MISYGFVILYLVGLLISNVIVFINVILPTIPKIYLSNLLHGLIVVCFHFYKKGILCSQMSVAHTALDVEHVRIQ